MVTYSRRITCERNESSRERKIALYKSDQQQQKYVALHTCLLSRLFCLLSHSAFAIQSASFSQITLNLKWCVRKTVTLLLVIWWVVFRPDIMTFSRDLEGRGWREGVGVKYGLDIKNQSRIPMISAWNCPRICRFKWLRGLYFTVLHSDRFLQCGGTKTDQDEIKLNKQNKKSKNSVLFTSIAVDVAQQMTQNPCDVTFPNLGEAGRAAWPSSACHSFFLSFFCFGCFPLLSIVAG